jgi:alpha-terpineol hydroxylase
MATQPATGEFASEEFRIPTDRAEAVMVAERCKDEKAYHEGWAWLRANQPLGWVHLDGFDPIWIVSRYSDVIAIERQAALFHNMDDNPILNTQLNDEFLKSVNNGTTQVVAALTHMDAPDHGLYRQIASAYFAPNRIGKLEAEIRAIAKETVAQLLAGPREIDFVKDFALMYPLRVIMSMFGVPREDEPQMLRLTQDFFGSNDPEERRDDVEVSPDMAARQFHRTLQVYYDYFSKFTQDRRESPRDDLMSLIANYKIDGEFISDFYANGYYVTIATAGHDTTSSSTATGMKSLAENPDQFAMLKADPSLIPTFVDEAIRLAAPVRHFMRTATDDAEVRGRPIKKGQRLMLSYPSASRDEDVFSDPNSFQVGRKPNRHLAFGSGPHMCLGQHLAKLEIRTLFQELLPHLESVELNGEPKYIETNFVGGLKSLPVKMVLS